MATAYRQPMQWMRRRGDRVRIISGQHAGHTGTVESNVNPRLWTARANRTTATHLAVDREAENVEVRSEDE